MAWISCQAKFGQPNWTFGDRKYTCTCPSIPPTPRLLPDMWASTGNLSRLSRMTISWDGGCLVHFFANIVHACVSVAQKMRWIPLPVSKASLDVPSCGWARGGREGQGVKCLLVTGRGQEWHKWTASMRRGKERSREKEKNAHPQSPQEPEGPAVRPTFEGISPKKCAGSPTTMLTQLAVGNGFNCAPSNPVWWSMDMGGWR